MKVENHQLITDPGEEYDIDQVALKKTPPNNDKKFESLIIRGTGTPTEISAKNNYISGQNLAHLVLGKDGNTIIQTTDFNRRAGAGFRFETTSIIISLVNVGYLIEFESQKSNFRHMDNFDPEDRLLARGVNDRKLRLWPCYPEEQLDLLLEVAATLMNHYDIKAFQSYEELRPDALHPGPTFPMVSFIERLSRRVPKLKNKKMIAGRAARKINLMNAPDSNSFQLSNTPIEEGTSVVAVEESDNWSLVEVLGDPEGLWRKGWLPTEDVQIPEFKPIINEDRIEGHMLETEDGAAFPYIPAGKGNFNARQNSNKPKYLVMHLTTGTQIQSTINTFRNAGSGVSTHLVIGRDGRVIQMVPFNYAAYHCGTGSWEGDANLNYHSIGIELDNAGRLTEIGGRWTKRKYAIPDDRVKQARHKNDTIERMYECYTDVQLKAAKWVAEALFKKYDLTDIIGHDDISPDRRYDPGPLFPLEDWREDLIGQREPKIQKYKTKTDAVIYKDHEGIPPRIPHPAVPNVILKNQQAIKKIIEKNDKYWLIQVNIKGRPVTGWVEKDAIKVLTQITKIQKEGKVDFFRHFADGGPPPTQLVRGNKPFLLPANSEVQILKAVGKLALVVTLKPIGKLRVTGWVNQDDIEPINP